jgi:hypothetical protein
VNGIPPEYALMQVDENQEETFAFSDEKGTVEVKNEIADMLLDEIDDPEKKYDLYYNAIDKVLRKHLPKGDKYKKAREWIYEEKNTFLTGKRKDKYGKRHLDGRQSYSSVMAELVNIIAGWIASNGTLAELYVILRDKNIEKGYGKPKQE